MFSRERPDRRTTPAGSGPAKGSSPVSVRAADARLLGGLVVVIVGPRPGDRVHQDGQRGCPRRSRLRSKPIASWTASSSLSRARLTIGGHVVGEARGRRSGAGRVGRGEDLVVADRPEKVEGGLELLPGLAAEADDDVRADRDPGNGLPDPLQPLPVVGDRVLASHSAQDGVVARLDREVQRLADGRARGHRGDQPVGEVPRMGRDEAQARDRRPPVAPRKRVDGPDQLGQVGPPGPVDPAARPALLGGMAEALLGRQVVAVAVDVLAEQRDLAVPGRGQRAGLGEDLVEGAAALRAAAERDDAVGAGLVAAVDDRQPGRDGRVPSQGAPVDRRRARSGEMIGRRDRSAVDDGGGGGGRGEPHRSLGRGQAEPLHELRLLVGAKEEVDGREASRQPAPVPLPDGAAGQDDPHPRVRRLERSQDPLAPDHLGLGRLADRAGVDDDQVGHVHRRRLGASRGHQASGHLLGVAPVHLAAERPHPEPGQGLVLRPVLDDARVDGLGGRQGGAGRGLRRGELEDRELSRAHRAAAGETCARVARAARIPSATSSGIHVSPMATA